MLSALGGSLVMAGALGVACSHQQYATAPAANEPSSSLLRPELGTSTAMGPNDPTRKPDVPVTKAPPLEPVPALTHPPVGPAPGNGTPAPTAAEIPKPPSGSPTPPDTANPLPAQPPTTGPLPQPAPVQPQPIAPQPPSTMPAPSTPPSMMPMVRADGGVTVPPAPGDAQVPPRPPIPRDAAPPPTPPTTPPRLPGGDAGIH